MNTFHGALWALVMTTLAAGCGRSYVRGSTAPGIDHPAMSTGLDKDDIQRMVSENVNHLRTSGLMDEWRLRVSRARVAIMPFRNDTTEHIEPQLAAILSEAETWLVESNAVTVVSRERQAEIIAEVERQQGAPFDPSQATRVGRQMGASFVVTGKIAAVDERTDDARRVQYLCYMQVIDVETGAVSWQRRSYTTKMVR